MNITDFEAASSRAAQLLKALSNERRLRIVCELGRGELSVSELERRVGLRQSALSQHLARLRRDGLVTTRRQSQVVYYSLAGEEACRLVETLYGLYRAAPAPADESTENDRRP